nr:MAG TPA: capsid scaffolding protein [Caudoviricetes sp.]
MSKGLKMNLQLMADAGAGGGTPSQTDGGTNNTDAGGGEGSNTGGTENQTPSFDDVLSQNNYKAEFDKRLKEALQTAQTEWETQQQEKITEAEKLKKMNADEKAKYEQDKRSKELDKREKDITTRELKAQAYETLAEKNLPKELIDALNFSDAETCNASIEAVEKAFQNAVKKAVEDRLRGSKPVKPAEQTGGDVFGFNFTGVRPRK